MAFLNLFIEKKDAFLDVVLNNGLSTVPSFLEIGSKIFFLIFHFDSNLYYRILQQPPEQQLFLRSCFIILIWDRDVLTQSWNKYNLAWLFSSCSSLHSCYSIVIPIFFLVVLLNIFKYVIFCDAHRTKFQSRLDLVSYRNKWHQC